jgi:exopolysaccharide biosynthesis predicted pyruvyltransferase EpsI
MIQYLHDLSAILKKKVIQLSMPWPGQNEDWIDIKIEGGPSEFIGYFQNASYVVTNSFHGMVFSVLMEKQFLVFRHSSKNARIENFLKKVDLESRLINDQKSVKRETIMDNIDWEHTKQLLEKEKEYSIRFIRDNCEVNKG